MHFRPLVAVLFVNFSTTVCRHLPVFNCTIQMSSGLFGIWVRMCHVHCLKPEFDLKSQVWFQTKTAQHEVQLPLYYIHFTYNLICYYINKIWNVFGCAVLVILFHWLGKRCNLEQTDSVNLWINHTAESQSDFRDHQWFQNGCNKLVN